MRSMKRLALGLVLLGCSGSAMAGIWSNALPPERFRGAGTAVVQIVPAWAVSAHCGVTPPAGWEIQACAKHSRPLRTVILPDPCPFAEAGEDFARRACHEFAHVRGWSAQHPD
ncbi:hypothetical protein J2X38_004088 [Sphingopyxis sp. BE235]|nr:hypothetical protein [Sphingopyxis sp. BE235]